MTKSTWKFDEYYLEATPITREMLDILDDLLFDVQYAKPGNKSKARRDASKAIVMALRAYYRSKYDPL